MTVCACGIPETFGAALQARREARGWTVPQLARASGVSQSLLWAYEAEKREPKPGTRTRLRVALGVAEHEDGGWWRTDW